MTYTIPEAAIRAAGHALRTRTGVDFDGWDGEAEIALRAALPHLQPTVPNTVDALDAAMPERDGRYQGDDGEWAVRHRKTRVIRAMRDRGDAENEARLNPDVEVVRRTVTAWRAL